MSDHDSDEIPQRHIQISAAMTCYFGTRICWPQQQFMKIEIQHNLGRRQLQDLQRDKMLTVNREIGSGRCLLEDPFARIIDG